MAEFLCVRELYELEEVPLPEEDDDDGGVEGLEDEVDDDDEDGDDDLSASALDL